jgi:hypothetical protein
MYKGPSTNLRFFFQIFLLLAFLAGIYVMALFNRKISIEKLTNLKDGTGNMGCPDLLVKKGNILMLYNSNAEVVDGINPLPFYNLDEYINYLENQRKKGIHCPVLFLQQENDAQGKYVYRVRPSPFQLEGGLPATTIIYKDDARGIPVPVLDASRDNGPYNANNYAGFDPLGLHVGTYTELDKIHDSTQLSKKSDNPMDANWGGIAHTQNAIESGKYEDNNVRKPVLFQPRGSFNPNLQGGLPQPKDLL